MCSGLCHCMAQAFRSQNPGRNKLFSGIKKPGSHLLPLGKLSPIHILSTQEARKAYQLLHLQSSPVLVVEPLISGARHAILPQGTPHVPQTADTHLACFPHTCQAVSRALRHHAGLESEPVPLARGLLKHVDGQLRRKVVVHTGSKDTYHRMEASAEGVR
ncbi:hypothetical protein BKA93DRAFT_79690 [Sparassis latifolia]